MDQSEGFVAEGQMYVSPMKQYFLFLDGEHLEELLVKHLRLPKEQAYTEVGRVRITVERLEE